MCLILITHHQHTFNQSIPRNTFKPRIPRISLKDQDQDYQRHPPSLHKEEMYDERREREYHDVKAQSNRDRMEYDGNRLEPERRLESERAELAGTEEIRTGLMERERDRLERGRLKLES